MFTTFSARRLINWKVPWTGCRLWMQPSRLVISVLFPGPCFGTKFRRFFPAGISTWWKNRVDDFPWKRGVFSAPDIRYQPEMVSLILRALNSRNTYTNDMFISCLKQFWYKKSTSLTHITSYIIYIYVIYMVFSFSNTSWIEYLTKSHRFWAPGSLGKWHW